MRSPLVLLAGNLGVGKTTLASKLGSHFGWWVGFESVADNPYLVDFYKDMVQWSFNLQVYFLNNRARLHHNACQQPRGAVLDRSIYEDRYIFAETLYEQALLSKRDFETYTALFELIVSRLRPPDLILYLKAPVSILSQRIRQRNQEFDRDLSTEYLKRIELKYETWIATLLDSPVLTIDSSLYNFTDGSDCSRMEALFSQIHSMV